MPKIPTDTIICSFTTRRKHAWSKGIQRNDPLMRLLVSELEKDSIFQMSVLEL